MMRAPEKGPIRLMIVVTLLHLNMMQNLRAALTPTKNQTTSQQDLTSDCSTSKVIQDNSTQQRYPPVNQVPQKQRLAFQLIIQDPSNEGKINSNNSSVSVNNSSNSDTSIINNSSSSNNISYGTISSGSSGSTRVQVILPKNRTTSKGLKRPYDIQYALGDTLQMFTPNLIKSLYQLELENLRRLNRQEEMFRKKGAEPAAAMQPRKKVMMNHRSELIRTQHRPPWRWREPPLRTHDDLSPPDLIGRRYKLRFTTMMPTTMPTTTEFFKLISSAHSPIKSSNTPSAILQERTGGIITANKLRGSHGFRTRTSRAPTIVNHEIINQQTSPTSYPSSLASRFKVNPPDGRVLSPAIVVKGGDSENQSSDNEGYDLSYGDSVVRAGNSNNSIRVNHMSDDSHINSNNLDSKKDNTTTNSSTIDNGRDINTSLHFDDDDDDSNQELLPKFSPLTFFNGKKPVTIIRHSKPKLPPIILVPNRVRPAPPTSSPAQYVSLIAKQRHKYDDKVMSPTLTVVDNDFNRLPPNSTSVHNNKLIVAMRPGRPQRRHPPTTQFPVYNIVAGITPPYPNNPPLIPYTRPPSYEGSVYGIQRPNGSESSHHHATQAPSNFGAPNIKFPAAESTDLQSEHASPPMPDKFNISIPDSANNVRPNNVPDKILMETEEQHSRPPETVVQSEPHIVSKPYGANSVSTQDGVMKIRTTRRPSRGSTTQRVSIVSANTTVVTTNPEQLHEVLSNVIDSHQQDHHHVYQNNNHGHRPHIWTNLLNYLSQLINSGVATSAVAFLTLIKTIFVALLVMFLPPMALAAAILQVISMG